jgi:hypothetical protein
VSFEFFLPFPVAAGGNSVKVTRPLASTPSPIATDPKDLVIWSGAGATLRSIAAGAIRYVPPTGPATLGALAVETRRVPWPWTTLVNDADEFIDDLIPATVFYENTDRATSEAAIRALIRAKYGNTPPAPENTMIDEFFAGNWVGTQVTDPAGAPIIQPLTVAAGADLGVLAAGHEPPPDAATPNSVVMKLRQEDGTTAIDIVDVARVARKQCRAEMAWSQAFSDLGLVFPFPFSVGTLNGQHVLFLNYTRVLLDNLNDVLWADGQLFQTDPTRYAGDLNQNLLLRNYLANAQTLYDTVRGELTDPCTPAQTFVFDLQTLWFNILLIDTYRYLHQTRLYVATVLLPQDNDYLDLLNDVDLRMAQFNTALSDIQADPHFAGRSLIENNVRWVENVVDILRLTSLQAIFVHTVGMVLGAISLVQGMIAGAGALARLASSLGGGGGYGGLGLVAVGGYGPGTVFLANGTTLALTAAEIEALLAAGILTARAANLILMAVFNPSGKGPTQADNWVSNHNPRWTKHDTEDKHGYRWVDENGIERIRFKKPKKPDKNDSFWAEREKLGGWRLQSKDGHYLDADGRVVCYRDARGNLNALHGRTPRQDTPEPVHIDANRPHLLTNGERFVDVGSLDDAQRLTHIAGSFR